MADYTYEQLKDMTVAQLREIAKGLKDDSLEGFSTMHKDHLLPAMCKVLGIHTHHAAEGAEKLRIKTTIRKLKTGRDAAIAAKDTARVAALRTEIHALKRRLRRLAVGS
ncbi:MAG TPA: hypothetical protein DCX07_15135 [Phycisphaerales bacterium]|nr:hypothetical protein [Phycisphaerales bacterium]